MKFRLILCKGTAGVWRIRAIHEAGGWADRTTVEDMDLAVRAGLSGWKFVYLGDTMVYIFSFINYTFSIFYQNLQNNFQSTFSKNMKTHNSS